LLYGFLENICRPDPERKDLEMSWLDLSDASTRVKETLQGLLCPTAWVVIAYLGVGVPYAHTASLDFDGPDFRHGTVVHNQYLSSQGVTIHAKHASKSPSLDLAITFDSTLRHTADLDLEDPWSAGNVSTDIVLGNLLIVPENDIDNNGDGIIDNPNDEGSRPAGSIFFNFSNPITSCGFDLIDIEIPEWSTEKGYFAALNGDGSIIEKLSFADLTLRDGAIFGDNTANRISPISLLDLGVTDTQSFTGVEINLGGSGALDNVHFNSVPAPPGILLLASGLMGLIAFRKKHNK
jgi:hypothetical protein